MSSNKKNTLTPFEEYLLEKRRQMLMSENFQGREVLEVGIFKGDNLHQIALRRPQALYGAAYTEADRRRAQRELTGLEVDVATIESDSLPFPDFAFDLVFSDTFFQFLTDENNFKSLLADSCRVCDDRLVLIEHTEEKNVVQNGMACRTVKTYAGICKKNDLELASVSYINAAISIRFNTFLFRHFPPDSDARPLAIFLQKLSLPVTKILDSFFPASHHLTKMVFVRKKEEYY